MRMFFALALLVLATPAFAQYENFNNPELERNMTGSMMLPTVIVDMPKTLGSGTVIYSNYLDLATICKVEVKAFPMDPLCAGKTEGQKQIRTYVLTAWHVMEQAYFPPPPEENKKNKKSARKIFMASKKPPPKPKMVSTPPEIGIIVRIASSTGEMDMEFKRHKGALVAYDERHDLALIRVGDDTIFPYVAAVAPRDVDLQPARKVWAVGAPFGAGPEMTEGLLSGTHEKRDDDVYNLSSADITHGNSGGGLYHYSRIQKRFELIAVSDAIVADKSHISLSVRTQEIHDFLDAVGLTFIAP